MISVGTLLAFVVVSGGILVLRYNHPHSASSWHDASAGNFVTSKLRRVFHSVPLIVSLYGVSCFLLSFCFVYDAPIGVTVLAALLLIGCFLPLLLHKQAPFETSQSGKQPFKTPFVPYLPALGMLINIWFIVELPISALVRVLIWASLGMVIYFGYGIRNSAMVRTRTNQ